MVRISERDSKWLKTTFTNDSFGKIMRGNVVYDYLYAEKILKGYDKIQRRGCGCEFGSLKRMVDKLYKEFLDAQE